MHYVTQMDLDIVSYWHARGSL